ncbi:MAG: hypothetical protein NVS9B2_00620 [Steroidobacteraceae bacterium]
MSSLDFDSDTRMSELEREWCEASEASIVARSDYRILAASTQLSTNLLDLARLRLDRTEARRAWILAKIGG